MALVVVYFLVLCLIPISVNSIKNSHMCNRTETYLEPVIRSQSDVVRIGYRQVPELRQRVITECCPGYGLSYSVCEPVCAMGCFRGHCLEPDTCSCYPGWNGKKCDEKCSPGYYGLNCIDECSCKNGASCSPVTGECNCTDGWNGSSCDIPCANDTYGRYCENKCMCQNGAKCNNSDGSCVCSPGYTGETCNETCPDGYWGLNCSKNCSCKNGAVCHPDNGNCNCTAGWRAQCNHINGSCICEEGYTGIKCEEVCPIGTWGKNCAESCDCKNGGKCLPDTGKSATAKNNAICDKAEGCICTDGFTGITYVSELPDLHGLKITA
ncbi:hypothetical protein CEXT_634731 [Caerostris extrusa]|uniref:EGF-like domain-containing protein n=1 Tax=Caerostris extrusa TaxID=172846 RepID=A0AAV4P4B6_CAEEX|nr:hypothetical protein CEXT_634731 [Caerostris extrusa]